MRDIANKNIGDFLSAETFNANFISELLEVVTSAGFTLDPELGPDTDLSMLVKSLVIYSVASSYFAESGAANNYILTRSGGLEPLPSYVDGMTVIFKPTNDNSGASVINIDSIGSKDLVASDGSALTGGEIKTDQYVIARYRGGTDDFEIVNSSAPGDAATLNGLASDTAATADTIAARDSSGDITANAFESTVATGTAPLTVASTTVVSNLNADLLDGQQGSYYAVAPVESTFTPVIEGTTTAGTGTYTLQFGSHQKIGNWVHFRLRVAWSAHTGTGNIYVKGLPYTPVSGQHTVASIISNNLTFVGTYLSCRVLAGTDTIQLQNCTSGAAYTEVAMDTAADIYISGSYEAA